MAIKIICDKCGKEVPEDHEIRVSFYDYLNDEECDENTVVLNCPHFDFCRECGHYYFQLIKSETDNGGHN